MQAFFRRMISGLQALHNHNSLILFVYLWIVIKQVPQRVGQAQQKPPLIKLAHAAGPRSLDTSGKFQ
jgi:hypothetical protein